MNHTTRYSTHLQDFIKIFNSRSDASSDLRMLQYFKRDGHVPSNDQERALEQCLAEKLIVQLKPAELREKTSPIGTSPTETGMQSGSKLTNIYDS